MKHDMADLVRYDIAGICFTIACRFPDLSVDVERQGLEGHICRIITAVSVVKINF